MSTQPFTLHGGGGEFFSRAIHIMTEMATIAAFFFCQALERWALATRFHAVHLNVFGALAAFVDAYLGKGLLFGVRKVRRWPCLCMAPPCVRQWPCEEWPITNEEWGG